jgi:small-conductance mechanosensitive channel
MPRRPREGAPSGAVWGSVRSPVRHATCLRVMQAPAKPRRGVTPWSGGRGGRGVRELADAALAQTVPTPAPIAAPPDTARLLGIPLVGIGPATGEKVLLTFALVALLWLLRRALHAGAGALLRGRRNEGGRFWARQGVGLAVALLGLVGLVSIWFNSPARLATAVGLVSAGLAFALQRVITAFAGYVVILRGGTFDVGDRISMGGVRGDVVALGFIQTTLMEMGEPPSVQGAAPPIWVKSRQYTGRIVTVTNDKIFDEPVFNYTRDFPYLWEEIAVPIGYTADRQRAEAILLACAARHTVAETEFGAAAQAALRRRFNLHPSEVRPRVYYRLTDNWLELTVRFLYREHGIRDVKDAMGRDIIDAFDRAGIGIASATYDIVGLPPVRLAAAPTRSGPRGGRAARSPRRGGARSPRPAAKGR